MKKLLLVICLMAILTGCASSKSSGQRDSTSDLLISPCAGCFDDDELTQIGIKVGHAS